MSQVLLVGQGLTKLYDGMTIVEGVSAGIQTEGIHAVIEENLSGRRVC